MIFKKMMVQVLLVVMYVTLTLAQVDPLCKDKVCRKPSQCRIVANCSTRDNCLLSGECLDFSARRGECPIERKVFIKIRDLWQPLTCGDRFQCPSSSYCIRSERSCCRAIASSASVKPGKCSPLAYESCYEMCVSDADCPGKAKCCPDTRCGKACRNPLG